MTAANRELVERFYEAVGGDLTAALSGDSMIELGNLLAPSVTDDFECEMVAPMGSLTFSGLDGFAAAWRDWIEPYSSFNVEIDEVRDLGDVLLMLVRQGGVIRRGEVPIEDASGSVWRFRDGRLARVEFYLDPEQARKAACSPDQSSR